jgi:Cellulase (glycosyl hydrolase family 5)
LWNGTFRRLHRPVTETAFSVRTVLIMHRRRIKNWACSILVLFLLSFLTGPVTAAEAPGLPSIEVAQDKAGFVLKPSGESFAPWGFNYDHDEHGRLLEDYWDSEWTKVEADFAEMKKLGANVVRIHLQLAKFMDWPQRTNPKALNRLSRLVGLAEREGLYLDLTGLGCYHKADVPAWYDKLDEQSRWGVQARFWEAVARQGAKSPSVFCYDLMNEPVVPGGRREKSDWLGPPFAGSHFVQFITLDQQNRARPDIARQWIQRLVTAIRKVDRRHLITVGLVDWSLDRKGLTSGFVPERIAADLDFVCVHLYPESGKLDEGLRTLKAFSVGKPVVVEETFPLKCSPKELDGFIVHSGKQAAGWISFYWGKPPEELRRSKNIGDAILLQWLELFVKRAMTR